MIRHIKFQTTNAYIKAFNKIVPYGPTAVAKFYEEVGQDLLKPVEKTTECYIKKGGKRIPYLKYAIFAVTYSIVYSNQLAKGASPEEAAVVAGIDSANPFPIGIDDVESAGEAIKEHSERAIDTGTRAFHNRFVIDGEDLSE